MQYSMLLASPLVGYFAFDFVRAVAFFTCFFWAHSKCTASWLDWAIMSSVSIPGHMEEASVAAVEQATLPG